MTGRGISQICARVASCDPPSTNIYSKFAWKRFIFDEPGNLKVPGMIGVTAGFYWFMSATPQNIFHHHYRCSKGTFMRDVVGSSYTEFENILDCITIKNHPDFIKMSFKL